MNSPAPQEGFEHGQQPLPPQEACLAALLDLKQVEEYGRHHDVQKFYEAFTGARAPDGLNTQLSIMPHDREDTLGVIPGTDPVLMMQCQFSNGVEGFAQNFQFLNEPEGVKAYVIGRDKNLDMYLARELREDEVQALHDDAVASKQQVVEKDAALLQLGPLVEEAREDGTRRFHVGDILAVMSDKNASARGIEGVYDLLTYLTGQRPSETQIKRFMEEVTPSLRQQCERLIPICEQMQREQPRMSVPVWLVSVIESLGSSFLDVTPIDLSQHTVMDPGDERALDYGPGAAPEIFRFGDER